ncbi:MAG: diacylglycerol kinase family protein [Cyanobacteriota bacterium]
MKAIVIINPVSGTKPPDIIKKELINKLDNLSYEYEVKETEKPAHAYIIAKEAVDNNINLVIVVGGDGTINEVVNAIACTDVCLGIIPNGTGNLLATSLGIPMDFSKSINIIFENNRKKIDLGRINNQYFSIIAGCGFDATIMKNVKRSDKKILGFLAYFIEGFKQALFPRRSIFNLLIDGKRVKKRALTVLFINSGNILGNIITIVPDASMTDGLLDVCIFSPQHTGEFIPVLWKILTKENTQKDPDFDRITHLKAKEIKFKCRPRLPVQADGDVIGYPPLDIHAVPDALNVIVPKKISTFVMNPEEFFKSLMEEAFNLSENKS